MLAGKLRMIVLHIHFFIRPKKPRKGTANPTCGDIFESSKLKAWTSLLPRFSQKRRSSFELQALKQHSKMSFQVGLAVLEPRGICSKLWVIKSCSCFRQSPRSHIRGCLWNSEPDSHANARSAFGQLFWFSGKCVLVQKVIKRIIQNTLGKRLLFGQIDGWKPWTIKDSE